MASPGGGFSVPIGFNIQGALQSLQQLVQAGAQTAQNLGQAFASVTPTLNVGQVLQNLLQVTQATNNLKSQGNIQITLIADGADRAMQAFQRVSQAASALARERYTLNLTANTEALNAGLTKVRDAVNSATAGQVVNLKLNLDEDQALVALQALQSTLKAAEQRGVKIGVTLDTEEAKREADRLNREFQAKQGKITFTITTDGYSTTASQFRQLDQIARQVSGKPISFNLQVDAGSARSIERFRQQLQHLQSGDNATVNIKGNANQLNAVLQHVQGDIRAVERRGVTIGINANPSQFNSVLQGVLSGAGRGFIAGSGLGGNLLVGAGSLTAATAPILAAAVAMQSFTQASAAAIQASISFNQTLEQQVIVFRHLTGSAESASNVIRELRRLADISPFGDQEVLAAGQAFIRVSQGDIERAKELTQLTVALGAAHPELGFEAMQLAIQQLVSGDYRAFEDRTNIAIGTVRELARQGLSGMELYRAAVAKAGGSVEILEKQNQTFAARITATQSAIAGINAAFGEGMFTAVSNALNQLNSVLVTHREGWEYLARSIGNAITMYAGLPPVLQDGLTVLDAYGKALTVIARAQQRREDRERGPESLRVPPHISQPTEDEKKAAIDARDARIAAQKAIQQEIDKTNGKIAEAKAHLIDIQRLQTGVQLGVKAITAEYEKQIRPLELQISAIQQMSRELERNVLFSQLGQAGASQRVEDAKGDPTQRAELAGLEARLGVERELIQIRNRRAEIAEEQSQREIEASRRVRDAQLDAQQAALEGLRREHQAHQEVRQAALERLREEVRGQQEVRQAALDRLREEIRANQEARQAALEGLREQVRAQQEARQEALEGLREQIRAEQEARQIALEGLREAIQARRTAYQEQRDLERELLEDLQAAYQERQRQEEENHRRSQNRRARQIEELREQEREEQQRNRGELPAERELRALEAANRERQRAQSLASAERNVLQARTGRERADALQRLNEIRADQAADRQREAAQERLRQQQEARDRAQEQRQNRINELERQQREEDRRYQEQREQQENEFRRQQAAIQQQQREQDRQEKARQRAEDQQLREAEKQAREQERQEQAKLREAEKIDRELQKQEAAQIRAAEQQAREQERQDQAKLREAEKLDRELQKQEQAQVRAAEQQARELDRQEQAKIRKEERKYQEDRRQEDAKRRQEDQGKDDERGKRAKELADAELKVLDARERVLKLMDLNATQAATRDATLNQILGQTADNAQKVKDLMDQLATVDMRAKLAELTQQQKEAIAPLQQILSDMDIKIGQQEKLIKDLEAQERDLRKRLQELQEPTLAERPRAAPLPGERGPWATIGGWLGEILDPSKKTSFIGAGLELAKAILGGFAQGLDDKVTTGGAIDAWTQFGRERAFTGWAANSPSRVTEELAYWVAEGFIQQMNFQTPFIAQSVQDAFAVPLDAAAMEEAGRNSAFAISDAFIQQANYQAPFIGQALRAPFEDFLYTWLQGVPQFYTDTMNAAAQALQQASGETISQALRAPFEYHLNEWLPGVPQYYFDTASASAAAWAAGYAEPEDLSVILRRPFEYHLNEWLPGFAQYYTDQAAAANAAWSDGYDDPKDLSVILREPFEYHIDWLRGVPAHFRETARDSVRDFTSAYNSPPNLFAVMRKPFEDFHLWARGLPPRFRSYGRESALEFKEGFCDALDLRACFAAAMQNLVDMARQWGAAVGTTFSSAAGRTGGSTGGGGAPSGGSGGPTLGEIAQAMMDPARHRAGSSGYWEVFVRGRWWVTGARVDQNRDPTARRDGGPITSGQAYLLHKDEFVIPPESGTVLPSTVLRGIENLAAIGSSSSVTNNAINTERSVTFSPHIVVNAPAGMNTEVLAQAVVNRAMEAFIDVLDDTEKRAPNPLPRILPGAVR